MNNERSKSGTGSKAADDDLALVKAAAWAWYLHGSGNESKPAREFDASRTKQSPRPSRYKLEAMRVQQTDQSCQPSNSPSPVGSPVNSLLDSYEIQSISKQLNYLLEDWSYAHNYVYVDDFDRREKSPGNNTRQGKANGRTKQGAWMRHAAAACGSWQGVIEAHLVVKGRTKKHGSFVQMGSANF